MARRLGCLIFGLVDPCLCLSLSDIVPPFSPETMVVGQQLLSSGGNYTTTEADRFTAATRDGEPPF